jgi:hypothetical protein
MPLAHVGANAANVFLTTGGIGSFRGAFSLPRWSHPTIDLLKGLWPLARSDRNPQKYRPGSTPSVYPPRAGRFLGYQPIKSEFPKDYVPPFLKNIKNDGSRKFI